MKKKLLIFPLVTTITFTPVASTIAESHETVISNRVSNQTEQMNSPNVTNLITTDSSAKSVS